MIGQKQIIDARMQGYKPAAIFLQAGFKAPAARTRFDDPDRALEFNLYPEIWLTESEMQQRYDWRFCVGCSVHIRGNQWGDALIDLAERIADAGASSVAVMADNNDILIFRGGEWHAHSEQ